MKEELKIMVQSNVEEKMEKKICKIYWDKNKKVCLKKFLRYNVQNHLLKSVHNIS